MLNVIALLWGIVAIAGVILDFLPRFAAPLMLPDIAFAVIGTTVGIVAAVRSRHKGSPAAVIGTALCFFAGVIMMVKLTISSGMQ